jgi:hypothetical protein
MPNATSATPRRVVLDWRHALVGPPEPCVLCGLPAICRSPVKGAPCHKGCAEAWITVRATTPEIRARLIARHTPKSGGPA